MGSALSNVMQGVEIPAFAGMTLVCAGMTLVCAGMTLVCAGMIGVSVEMRLVCGNEVGVWE